MNYTPIIVLGVVIVVFYALMILPQQRRMREHRQLLAELKSGDKIITVGGLYGTVKSVSEDKIAVEIAKGVEVMLAKQAISGKVESKSKKSSED